jgi:hypothetical protein
MGLWTWLTTGQQPLVFCAKTGSKPPLGKAKHAPLPQPVALIHLRTRLPNNKYTHLGRWLEAWELHRLPELWNVICGDLGLVGVKPLTADEAQQITEAWQQKRYDDQIGFTGLWYTAAWPQSTFDEICIIDAYQAATRTWWSHWQQLIRTPAAWWRRGRQRNIKANTLHYYDESIRPYAQFVNAAIGESTTRDSRVHSQPETGGCD